MSKAPTGKESEQEEHGEADRADLPICGMVRPIATMGDAYPETHWIEVHEIVAEAAQKAGYRLRLVSESDQVGIIVSEIIRNLNDNPIVVVDVSGRNPNVMFELGMRVTFQKPVVIITDEHTPFSFDIQAIKHVQYRRDLRTLPTRRFQAELTEAIVATVQAANKPGHRGYLQQFGPIEVTDIGEQSVTLSELAEAVRDLRSEFRSSRPVEVRSAAGRLVIPANPGSRPLVFSVPKEVAALALEAVANEGHTTVDTKTVGERYWLMVDDSTLTSKRRSDLIARLFKFSDHIDVPKTNLWPPS